ncbi:hypothetical protein [Pseudomonas phage PIP]|nr:hypothetical protein [Pseudomonas phage PIP]
MAGLGSTALFSRMEMVAWSCSTAGWYHPAVAAGLSTAAQVLLQHGGYRYVTSLLLRTACTAVASRRWAVVLPPTSEVPALVSDAPSTPVALFGLTLLFTGSAFRSQGWTSRIRTSVLLAAPTQVRLSRWIIGPGTRTNVG